MAVVSTGWGTHEWHGHQLPAVPEEVPTVQVENVHWLWWVIVSKYHQAVSLDMRIETEISKHIGMRADPDHAFGIQHGLGH